METLNPAVLHTILIVSSDAQLSKLLNSYLEDSGHRILTVSDGIEALYLAEKSNVTMIILDSDIPKVSASDISVFIKKIPRFQNIFLILLHKKNYTFELNGTIDEYIEKPVTEKLLVSKVKSLLRSPEKKSIPPSLMKKIVGDLAVDRDTYMVYYQKKEILLPRKEFELVYLLATRPEKVFTREEIFKNIWHKEITPKEGRTIDVHIRKLRSKISEDIIITVKGVGYKMMK